MEILRNITFHLCDLDSKITDEWKFYFGDFTNFKFYNCDIFSVPIVENEVNAIVSPANSFGDLEGGIDLVYYKKFGCGLGQKLQSTIIEKKFGELIIGDALIIPINKMYGYEYFISAPTMRVPMNIQDTANIYLAFRAILIELIKFNSKNKEYCIKNVICPGLGTGIGKVSAEICAKQMYKAYNIITNPNYDLDLYKMSYDHIEMTQTIEKIDV